MNRLAALTRDRGASRRTPPVGHDVPNEQTDGVPSGTPRRLGRRPSMPSPPTVPPEAPRTDPNDFRPPSEAPSFRSSLLGVLLGDLVLVGVVQALLPKNRGPLTAVLLVAALSVPFLAARFVRPLLYRLAWRDIASQARASFGYLLTAVLGTAAIASSFSVQNALETASRRPLYSQLGPVDEIVDVSASTDRGEALRRITDLRVAPIDGVLPIETQSVEAAVIGSNGTFTVQLIATDLAAAAQFGRQSEATGLAGPVPIRSDQVLVSRDLADALGVKAGSQLQLDPRGAPKVVTVERVLPPIGLAGLRLDGTPRSGPKIFLGGHLPPTTSTSRRRHLVLVSNRGDVISGADESAAVTAALENVLAPSVSSADGATTALNTTDASVVTVKADAVASAELASRRYRAALSGTNLAGILVGALLLIVTALSLADQRRHERGVLRAMGLRRSSLLGVTMIEGWMLAITSAVVGTAVGAGIARVVVIFARRIFGRNEATVDLGGHVGTAGLGTGLVVGFLAALGATTGAALWESRRDALTAARGLPAPPPKSARLLPAAAAVLVLTGGGLGALAWQRNLPIALLLGLACTALGITLVARGRARWRLPVTLIAIATTGSALATPRILPRIFERADARTYVLLGLLVIAGMAGVLLANFSTLGEVMERIGAAVPGRGGSGPRSLAARVAAAEPRARPGRSVVITCTFAVTVFTAMLLSLLGQIIDRQTSARTALVRGGFVAQADLGGPSAALPVFASNPGVAHLADHAIQVAQTTRTGTAGFRSAQLTQFDQAYASAPPVVDAAVAGIKTSNEAFAKVLAEPGTAIVGVPDGEQGRGTAFVPGQVVPVRDPYSGRSLNLTIIGVTTSWGTAPSVWTNAATATNLAGPLTVNRLLLPKNAVPPSTPASPTASAGAVGVKSIGEVIAGQQQPERALLRLLQGHLAVGFLTALVGLATVLTRTASERRRSIGVLRSIGASASTLRRAFVLEAVSFSVSGAAIGVLAAVLCVWRLLASGEFGRIARPPVEPRLLIMIFAGAVVAAIVAASLPARRATKASPASTLR